MVANTEGSKGEMHINNVVNRGPANKVDLKANIYRWK